MSLTLPATVLAAVRAHAGAAYPEECCGLLVGEAATAGARVTAVVPVANCGTAPGREFELAPGPLVRALAAERRGGPAVLGVYHSHPDAVASPSGRDSREAWPGWSDLIVAVSAGQAGEARSFRRPAAGAPLVEEPLELLPA
ncbi:MAG TPA: M67 family metallopeptidase, partial [Thermoanaerobaculia bacterium]|nr:M67 family metallopeptidase [Thermoanaerobaculia bacterium]